MDRQLIVGRFRRHLLCFAAASLGMAGTAVLGPAASSAAELTAGGFVFSDKLGGFRLISASGTGTSDDPIILVEELMGIEPVILVIRRPNAGPAVRHPVRSQLTLVKQIVNRSNRVWAGFEVELQEILRKPSVYGDGLSFKQFGAQPKDVESDIFTLNDRRFEPYDRITFQGGSVDPDTNVRLRLTITDPTPVPEFYLQQNPNILSAQAPVNGRSFSLLRD